MKKFSKCKLENLFLEISYNRDQVPKKSVECVPQKNSKIIKSFLRISYPGWPIFAQYRRGDAFHPPHYSLPLDLR